MYIFVFQLIILSKNHNRTIARFFFYFLPRVFFNKYKIINNNIYLALFLHLTHLKNIPHNLLSFAYLRGSGGFLPGIVRTILPFFARF